MKKILIVGQGSYIGTSFAKYASKRFEITTVDAKNDNWQQADFSDFDTILHCAGIAHQKQNDKDLYYKINCDLAVAVAKKAKASGVGQFVYLSSMAVYGKQSGKITKAAAPTATDFYGGSKLKAEALLSELVSENFNLCIVRPPMVYGRNAPGNFQRLVKLATKAPFFPTIENRRSMIYIDNLCEFLCQAFDQNKKGIYTPQNAKHVNTLNLVQLINSNLKTTALFNPLVRLMTRCIPTFSKLFSDLYYPKVPEDNDYYVVGFKESIKLSLKK